MAKTIGETLRELREKQNKSQNQLSIEIGVTPGLISVWERGTAPQMKYADALAMSLNVPVDRITDIILSMTRAAQAASA